MLTNIQTAFKFLNEASSPLKVFDVRGDGKAVLPNKSHAGDAGFDICNASEKPITIKPLCRAVIPTGISIQLPDLPCYARVAPRSGLAVKHGINVLAGVIDAGYRGEIMVCLHNTDPENSFTVNIGDRIAQLVIEPILPTSDAAWVNELNKADRGENGFGSTGK